MAKITSLPALLLLLLAMPGTGLGEASYTGYSGAPGTSGTCAGSCHGSSGGTITVTGFPTTYVPGQAYTIRVRHTSGSTIRQFNCSVRRGTGSTNAGTITAGLNTTTYNTSGETNGIHLSSSSRDSGIFTWTAPAAGTGSVKLYFAGLQGSYSGQNTLITQTATEQTVTHDVGCVSLRAPSGSIDSGTVVTPACTVANLGTVAETYRVRMRIGTFYNDTARVSAQAAGARTYVTFPAWTALTVGGPYTVTCTTELTGDAQPANNCQTGSVAVTRPVVHDVGAVQIIAPVGTLDTGSQITPTAVIRNFGAAEETFPVRFFIGGFYWRDTTMTLAAGASDTARFAPWNVAEPGTHVVRCSTMLGADANATNDAAIDSVVVPATGIEARTSLVVRFAALGPNPFSGRTSIGFGLPVPGPVRLAVYDAAGIEVRVLFDGWAVAGRYSAGWDGLDNRGSRVAPGVYNCRLASSIGTVTRKLVKLQ